MRRLLDKDPLTGTKSVFHYDHEDDSFVIETVTDVEDVVEINKAAYNERAGTRFGEGLAHHVAQIPATIWWDLKRRGIADDPKALKAWLNDRDNRAFRTRPGRL